LYLQVEILDKLVTEMAGFKRYVDIFFILISVLLIKLNWFYCMFIHYSTDKKFSESM